MSDNDDAGQFVKAALLKGIALAKAKGLPVDNAEDIKKIVELGTPALKKKRLEEEAEACENNLALFLEKAWPSIDSAVYMKNWAVDALCEHLQAVTNGEIRHLLINFPPRCTKTTVASICFPAWTWARPLTNPPSLRSGPNVKFLCGSYSDRLSLQNSTLTRRLILSPWYQERWGNRFTFMEDQNTKTQYDTSAGGSRVSTSVGGGLLGIGGDIIIVDDPHNTEQAESEAERLTALNWWKEISTTRLNNAKLSPIIVIMQRLHEEDVSGQILSSEWAGEFTHLMIPMEYEWRRHCVTSIGWEDPRGLVDGTGELGDTEASLVGIDPDGTRVPAFNGAEPELEEREGEIMWPERFGPKELARIKHELGTYMSSGRLQQAPVPDKGGIFERGWWNVWEPPDGKFPPMEPIIVSLDTAFTEKEQNSPTGCTVWGSFVNEGKRRIMLTHAWRKHLAFSGERQPQRPNETYQAWKDRTSRGWGLIEWIMDTCVRYKADFLLIEAKASGHSASQELRKRYGLQDWAVHLLPIKGDKVARALAVQPIFTQGLIYAPKRGWSEMVIDEAAMFPKGKYSDLVDSMTLALKWMRDRGLAEDDAVVEAEERQSIMHRPRQVALYPV